MKYVDTPSLLNRGAALLVALRIHQRLKGFQNAAQAEIERSKDYVRR